MVNLSANERCAILHALPRLPSGSHPVGTRRAWPVKRYNRKLSELKATTFNILLGNISSVLSQR